MSFIAAIGGAIAVGSAIYGGVQGAQQSQDADEGRNAVWDIYSKQMNILKDKTSLARKSVREGFTQTKRQAGDILEGADLSRLYGGQATGQKAVSEIGEIIDFSQQNTGLATSGSQELKTEELMGSAWGKYQTDLDKIVATRGLQQDRYETTMAGARTQRSLGLREADISFDAGYEDLQRMREDLLTGIDQEDVGFWGGFFGG